MSGAATLTGTALADCGKAQHRPPPQPALDVTRFGAVGDGRTDDTAALQRALAALTADQTLLLPSGRTFRHSQVLTVAVPGARLTGGGTLLAADEESSALMITADRVTVDGVTLRITATTRRWEGTAQNKLYIGPVNGTLVRDVVIDGSAAAGVLLSGSSSFTLQRLTVSRTRADGIHMTGGSRNGTVDSPHVSQTGDDGVAVVSYLRDGAACHSLTVTDPTVRDTGARGLSVVGGETITYRGLDVSGTAAAAVYVACEGAPFNTAPSSDVTVAGGTIRNANTDPKIDHGAVLVYSGRAGGSVSNVTVRDLDISATRARASRQIGVVRDSARDGVADIVFSGLALQASPQPYQGNVPTAAVTLSDVTAGGRSVEP